MIEAIAEKIVNLVAEECRDDFTGIRKANFAELDVMVAHIIRSELGAEKNIRTMTKDEALKELNAMAKCEIGENDAEDDHGRADQILLDYLAHLKETEVVEAYLKAKHACGFWYA
jgi:hypothetical protein